MPAPSASPLRSLSRLCRSVALAALGAIALAVLTASDAHAQGGVPVVTIATPAADTVITDADRHVLHVRVEWCDPDGAVASRTVTLGGSVLTDNFTPVTRAGCATAGVSEWLEANIPLLFEQSLIAIATDAEGNADTVSRRITYAPPSTQFQPEVTPKGGARMQAPGTSGEAVFVIKNVGVHYPLYMLALVDCGALTGCVPSKGETAIQPGGVDTVRVAFTVPTTLQQPTELRLIARYDMPLPPGTVASQTAADTGRIMVTPLPGPLITIVAPGRDTVITEGAHHTMKVRVEWCDPDGGIASRTVTLGGSPLPDNFTTVSRSGCVTASVSEWLDANIPLLWEQQLVATATDTEGHQAQAIRSVTYAPPMEQFQPEVTPEHASLTVNAGASDSARFIVRNVGIHYPLYVVGLDCGTLASCAPSKPHAAIQPGAVDTVTVDFTTHPELAQTTEIRLRATYDAPLPPGTVPLQSVADTGVVSVRTVVGGPGPRNLVLNVPPAPVGEWRIDYSWTNGDSSAATNIYRNGAFLVQQAPGVTSAYNDGGLSPGTTYTYELRHVKNNVESTGVTASATTRIDGPDAPPRDLVLTIPPAPQGEGRVDYSWVNGDPTAATNIYRNGAFLVQQAPGVTSAYNDGGLSPGTTYTYELRHVKNYVESVGVTGTAATRPGAAAVVAFQLRPTPASVRFAQGVERWVPFTLTNLGSDTATFYLRATVTGGFTNPIVMMDTARIAPNGSATAKALVTATGAVGTTATFTMTATHVASSGSVRSASATSALAIAGASYGVTVTPKGWGATLPSGGGTYRIYFDVTNTGYSSSTFTLTSTCPGNFTVCRFAESGGMTRSVYLEPGERSTVHVEIADSTDAGGQISLSALHPADPTITDWAIRSIYSGSATRGVAVTPDGGALNPVPAQPTSVPFEVRNTGLEATAFQWTMRCEAGATCPNGTSGTTPVVLPGATEYVEAQFTAPPTAGGTGALVMRVAHVADPAVVDSGTILVTSTDPPVYRGVAIGLGATSVPMTAGTGGVWFIPIQNRGNASDSFDYEVTCTGAVSCVTKSGRSPSVAAFQTWETTMTLNAVTNGVGYVNHWARSVADPSVIATKTITVQVGGTGGTNTVAVLPANGTASPQPGSAGNPFTFTIRNDGTSAASFQWSLTCPASLACVSPSGTSDTTASLAANGGTATVSGTYTAPAAGQTAVISLTATQVGAASVTATGQLTVTGQVPTGVTVHVATINPGANISRDQCLTIAAGDDAAYECGDLRVVHALPATTTMNKTRAPALIYSSAHAAPRALIAADVTLNVSPMPTSIRVVARVQAPGGEKTAERTITGTSSWLPTDRRRVVLELDAAAKAIPTGAYTYALEVYTQDGTVLSGSDTGTVVVIDRRDSPFGSGWWLDGLEQLVAVHGRSDQQLWIGGDGSTRLYTQQGTSSIWRADSLSRPDSIVRVGTEWIRPLRNGAQVTFDNDGRHIATRNDLGHVTSFLYTDKPDVTRSLDRILLPVPQGTTAPQYQFGYAPLVTGGRYRLQAVTAPAISASEPRVATLGYVDPATQQVDLEGRVRTISDPSSPAVRLAHDGSGKITSRTNRRGHAWAYEYDAGALRQATLADASLAGGQTYTRFCAAEASGLSACSNGVALSSEVVTVVDGSRTDLVDVSTFSVNRWGAPTKIVNALAHEATVERSDPTYAHLVTGQSFGGLTSRTTYNRRGLPVVETVVNPLGDGQDAVTSYEWHEQWDAVVAIRPPLVTATTVTYNANGDPLTVSQGAITTTYEWVGRELRAVVAPDASRSTMTYDGLGNTQQLVSPTQATATTTRDAIGRPWLTVSPGGDGSSVETRVTFGAFDEALQIVTTASGRTRTITQTYDAEGNTLTVQQSASPDEANVGTMGRSFEYDAAHRITAEGIPNVNRITYQYDAAGNLIAGGRTNGTVNYVYDALNRLTTRTGTSGTSSYAYDAAGNLTAANNDAARIARTYFPNGLLKSDELRIATGPASGAADFTQHVYQLRYSYDVLGRRTRLEQPTQFGGATTYAYHAGTGQLETMVDPAGHEFRNQFDNFGRLQSAVRRYGSANPLTDAFTYDGMSRPLTRQQTLAGLASPLHSETFAYDPLNKIRSVVAIGGTDSIAYDAFAQLQRSDFGTINLHEQLRHDPLGNVVQSSASGRLNRSLQYQYGTGTGRLARITNQSSESTETIENSYDALGNLEHSFSNKNVPAGDAKRPPYSEATNTNNAYDDRNLLVATDYSYERLEADVTYTYDRSQEFRYDALGRRVWYHTRIGSPVACADIEPGVGCTTTTNRVIWDGEQILYEIRAGGEGAAAHENDQPDGAQLGVVRYTHAGGLDAPIAVYRAVTGGWAAILPLSNWRGQFDSGVCDGGLCTNDQIRFPGAATAYGEKRRDFAPPAFWGTLVEGMTDASGYVYQRNRYYDPVAGRFTQEDPIGFDGGMNLYGYAAGDPVNHSDPSGLSPICVTYRLPATYVYVAGSGGMQSRAETRTVCWEGGSSGGGAGGYVPTIGPATGSGGGFRPGGRAARDESRESGVLERLGSFLSSPCTAASAAVGVDVLSVGVLVVGAVHVGAAFAASRVAAVGLERAFYYAAVNGGRSSVRRLARASLAWGGAVDGARAGALDFGFGYFAGIQDDALRGGSWKSFIPGSGLVESIPKARAACR